MSTSGKSNFSQHNCVIGIKISRTSLTTSPLMNKRKKEEKKTPSTYQRNKKCQRKINMYCKSCR